VHTEPLGHPDWAPPDPVGNPHRRDHGWAGRIDRWEVTIAQALADSGYATGMWGKWHLGSEPEERSPVDFGFDEAVWCPRSADEVLWSMQSYFPEGTVTSAPYAGEMQIPMELEPIYSRKKGAKSEVIATYGAKFRADFDRKITEWAMDFMGRAKAAGKPFYMFLPYTQVHIPPIPDPEFAGKTKRGNWADLLTQMDAFTGMLMDKLDELGLANDTIVVWTADNSSEVTYRAPAMDPDPLGGQWKGFCGPWRGGYVTSLEGSNRAPCIIRWPGKVPADRQIDGMDMSDFLLGNAEESGRDRVVCLQGNRLQAVKWRQWKAHLFQQDDAYSTWSPYNVPHIHNLEWDPREEHEVGFPHAWVLHPMAAAVAAFLKSLALEPPIKTGTPDPYLSPKPGELRVEEHIQLGVITQFITTIVKTHKEGPPPATGFQSNTC